MMTKTFLILALLLFSISTFASNYFGGGYGVQTFKSEILDKYDVSSTGALYGGFFGVRERILGLEGFYYRATASGDIIHNNNNYNLETQDSFYGAALRFHVNMLTFKLGYAFHRIKQEFQQNDNAITPTSSMKSTYDVSDNIKNSRGLALGIGLRLPFNKNFSIYSDFSRYELSTLNASIMSIEAGVRFDVKDLFPTIMMGGNSSGAGD